MHAVGCDVQMEAETVEQGPATHHGSRLFSVKCTHHLFYFRFTRFCFNATCQFTPIVNLRPLVFGLAPFDWLHSVMLIACLLLEYHF